MGKEREVYIYRAAAGTWFEGCMASNLPTKRWYKAGTMKLFFCKGTHDVYFWLCGPYSPL